MSEGRARVSEAVNGNEGAGWLSRGLVNGGERVESFPPVDRNVALKRCARGHEIDESWDLCPYCPAERSAAAVSPATRQPRVVASLEPGSGARVSVAAHPSRTVAAPLQGLVETPERLVVGWLVGLDGSTRGESFPLRTGRNIIGRGSQSDVVVPDEQASTHHADLVYRPEQRRFLLMDHNSTNGTHVNGEEISSRVDLSQHDVIRIGRRKYLFQPLCGESFSWDDEVAGS
jgi:pSer/pThr/pTyr-binding forkhead associated (FHA) protein